MSALCNILIYEYFLFFNRLNKDSKTTSGYNMYTISFIEKITEKMIVNHINIFLAKITSPSDGTELVVLSGSDQSITWTFDDDISNVAVRVWSFTSSDGSPKRTLAVAVGDGVPQPLKKNLPEFDVTTQGALVLKNVNQSYDGTYELKLEVVGQPVDTSNVRLFIASKFCT